MSADYPTYVPEERTVILGATDDSIVVAPWTPAHELAQFLTAVRNSMTWGEFRAACPPGYWRQQEEWPVDDEWGDDEGEPGEEAWARADSEPFGWGCLRGMDDAECLPWPAQQMLFWMPDHMLSEFSTTGASMVSGPAAVIPLDRLDELVTAFEACGFEVVRDDDLIRYISHYGTSESWEYIPPEGALHDS